jgi:HSP20 family protein
MSNETKTKQTGATSYSEHSGHEKQQQAYQKEEGQQGGAQQGSGQRDPGHAGREQQRSVQVGHGAGGAMQQRGQGGLARYTDPFSLVQQLSNEMDELFESFFYGRPAVRRARQAELRNLWAPEIEVREEENQLRISVDLPGISKDNVKVDVQEGALTIQGERREERNEGDEKQGYRRSERRYGSFYRSIPLPEGADAENAQAQMKEGVLEIILPLAQRARGRRLEIKGG